MITRRQARLLSLTGGTGDGEESPPTTTAPERSRTASTQPLSPSPPQLSPPVMADASATGTDLRSRTRRASADAFMHTLAAQTAGGRRGRPLAATPEVPTEAQPARVFPRYTATPAVMHTLAQWRGEGVTEGTFVCTTRPHQASTLSEWKRSPVKVEAEVGESGSTATPPVPRLTSTQAKTAWRACVRELTAGPSPAAGGRTPAPLSVPQGVVRERPRASTATPDPVRLLSWCATSAPRGCRGWPPGRLMEAWASKRAFLEPLRMALALEVPRAYQLATHQARMRLLLSRGGDDPLARPKGREAATAECTTASTATVALTTTTAGEEAYWKLLDPAHSEKEANILRVVSAIDSRLRAQLQAIYQERFDDQEETEESRGEADSTASASTHGDRTHHSGCHSRLRPMRRLEIVDALISCATESLPAFTKMLMGYQQEGVRWLMHLNFVERTNGMLADDMGLGKTAQSVIYMAVYHILIVELVERQLGMLLSLAQGAVERCWRLVSDEGGASSGSPTAIAVAAARVRELVAAVVGEAGPDGVVLPALRPLWPLLARAEDEEGETREESSGHVPRRTPPALVTPAQVLLKELSPYLCAIRALKQVKQWVWQLDSREERGEGAGNGGGGCGDDDDDNSNNNNKKKGKDGAAEDVATAKGLRTRATRGTAGRSSCSSPRGARSRAGSASATGSDSHGRRTHMPGPAVVLPRRRGRPSKSDLAARAAAAATEGGVRGRQAGVGAGVSPCSPTASLSAEERGAARQFLSAALAIAGVSRATSTSLERPAPMLPMLVIAPLSTLPHWRKEFEHFGVADRFEVYLLNGSRDHRDAATHRFLRHVQLRAGGAGAEGGEALAEGEASALSTAALAAKTPVLVIPHDLLVRQGLSAVQRGIAHVHYHVVIIDEAQRIKSSQGALFHRVCRLSSLSRLALTGTPLQNNVVELFSLLQFLAPAVFHGKGQQDLLARLDAALAEASRSCALEDVELHVLLCRRVHRLLSPFILRRDKSVVKAMLPVKREFTIVCPLLPYQREKLAEVDARHQEGTLGGNPSIQRRKILLHPYTMMPYFYVDDGMLRASGKLLVLDFMIRFMRRTGHKFLVFCGWTLVLDVVETLCQVRDMPYVRLDGKTSVEDREAHIASFSAGGAGEAAGRGSTVASGTSASSATSAPPPCCFLISKVAGGVGLNLQSADTVFLLDVDYNPQRDHQALSRVYRVGQRREVRVYRLLIDHPTERGVLAIHTAKESLERAVVQAGKYDLHTSADEKEAALQALFAERSGQGGAAGGGGALWARGCATDEAVAQKPTPPDGGRGNGGGAAAVVGVEGVGTTASPASPSSPLFPFGVPYEEGSAESCAEEEAVGSSPVEAVCSGLTRTPSLTVPLDSGPVGSPSTARAPRRVRFALPHDDGDDGDAVGAAGVAGGHKGRHVGGSASPTSPSGSAVAGILKRGRGVGDGDGPDAEMDAGPSPARHILALRADLSRALPRTAEESAILADMFDETEAEALEEEEGGRGRARRRRSSRTA